LKKIIVTGANGFLGRYLLPKLIQCGYDVTAISSQPDYFSQRNDGVRWVNIDLFDEEKTKQCLHSVRPQILIHLAWYTEHGKFWESSNNFRWIDVTARLLECFKDAGGERLLIAGTCAEYDWRFSLLNENLTPTNPRTLYGKCKDITRQYAENFCTANDLELIWARIFFPYGPGESNNKLLPSILLSLIGRRAVQCSHGWQYRDFLHVDDVAFAITHLISLSGISGVFNIASGVPLRINSLVKICSEYFSECLPPDFGAITVPPDDPLLLVGDIGKLESTGWRQRIKIEEGVRDYIRFLQLRHE